MIAFLASPQDIRWVIYTPKPLESLNSSLRRAVKTRAHFPNDTAAMRLLYLAPLKVQGRRTKARNDWSATLHQFAIYFERRIPE